MKIESNVTVAVAAVFFAIQIPNAHADWAATIVEQIETCSNCRLRVKFVLAVDDSERWDEADDGWAFVTEEMQPFILVRTEGDEWFKEYDRLSSSRWGHVEWSPWHNNIVGGDKYTFHTDEGFALIDLLPSFDVTDVATNFTKTVPIGEDCGLGI